MGKFEIAPSAKTGNALARSEQNYIYNQARLGAHSQPADAQRRAALREAKRRPQAKVRALALSESQATLLLILGGAFLLMTLLLLLPTLASANSSAQAHEQFKVEKIKGTQAWYNTKSQATKLALKQDQILTVGDTIFTKDATTVRLSLPDGSMIKVGANTVFKITAVAGSTSLWQWTFQLLNGTVRALIKKATSRLGTKSKVRIKTPSGTAGVRGTDYVVSYSDKTREVRVHVNEGSVWLGPNGASSYVESDVSTELLISGYCSRSQGGNPPQKAERCGSDYIPTEKSSGVNDGELKFVPSRLQPASANQSRQRGKNSGAVTFGGSQYTKSAIGEDRKGDNTMGETKKSDERGSKAARMKKAKYFSAILLKYANLGNEKLAVEAINGGADVNATDAEGNTPLILAARHQRTEALVYKLISSRA